MTNREPGRRNDYRIDVDHFGPIQRASVDMRPFTVFIGPSNTGKSYLAVLIYALHRSLHMGYGRMPRTATRSVFRPIANGAIICSSAKDRTLRG